MYVATSNLSRHTDVYAEEHTQKLDQVLNPSAMGFDAHTEAFTKMSL